MIAKHLTEPICSPGCEQKASQQQPPYGEDRGCRLHGGVWLSLFLVNALELHIILFNPCHWPQACSRGASHHLWNSWLFPNTAHMHPRGRLLFSPFARAPLGYSKSIGGRFKCSRVQLNYYLQLVSFHWFRRFQNIISSLLHSNPT